MENDGSFCSLTPTLRHFLCRCQVVQRVDFITSEIDKLLKNTPSFKSNSK